MVCVHILVLLAIFSLLSAEKEDPGDYGKYTLWRKKLCEINNQTLYEGVGECIEKQLQPMRDDMKDCFEKVVPGPNASFVVYQNAGCRDQSVFFKMDECLNEKKKIHPDEAQGKVTLDCLKRLSQKYYLKDILAFYWNDTNLEE